MMRDLLIPSISFFIHTPKRKYFILSPSNTIPRTLRSLWSWVIISFVFDQLPFFFFVLSIGQKPGGIRSVTISLLHVTGYNKGRPGRLRAQAMGNKSTSSYISRVQAICTFLKHRLFSLIWVKTLNSLYSFRGLEVSMS